MANERNENWKDVSASIDLFLVEHEGKYDEGRLWITKSHWVHDKERKQCSNKNCQLKFSLTERKHHCRRCGEIFCSKCTSYTQRLSLLAQRDPDGNLYKVCILCFDREGQPFGHFRNLFNVFKKTRSDVRSISSAVVVDEIDSGREDVTVGISRRLETLTSNYHDHLNGNGIKSTVVDLVKSPVAVPSWQIPKCGLKTSRFCFLCTKKFTLLSPAHHCRVCGEAVCLGCSQEELLLYVGEGCSEKRAHWAIINVTGCPSEPPQVCECLRLCTSCHSHAVHCRLQLIVQEQKEEEENMLRKVDKYYVQLTDCKQKIDDILKKYQQLVNAIESERDLRDIIPRGESTTRTLAKYNSDTSDLFTQFAIEMQSFKKVRPRTSNQLQLVSSIIISMHSYYSKNFFTFRDLQRILENILGQRALESVQIIVDYQTINCVFLALWQLGLECLELCDKHTIDSAVASLLSSCGDTCKQDLQVALELSGENWQQHEEKIREFLKINLKEKRLIVPSKKKKKAKDMEDLLLRRCDMILMKIGRQLNAKARANKFKQTKAAVNMAHSRIKELQQDV